MPLISVILPLYNSEKTIRETLESVFGQTFSDLEIIAVNDGSKDSTLDILATIKDPRLKVFSYPNAGISVSRNRGLALAQGEFIAFLDHDDLWTADKLELQLKALQENPQAAVAYSWVDFINESSQFLRKGSRPKETKNIYADLLIASLFDTASNPLIRKSVLITVEGFDESIFGPEDWELFIRIAAHYHFVAVPKVQVLYRMMASSASGNITKQETEIFKVIDRAFSQAPESLQHLKKRSITKNYLYLTFRALEFPLRRENGIVSARFLWQAVKNDPSILRRKSISLVLFKIAALIILPSGRYPKLINQVKRLKSSMNEQGKKQIKSEENEGDITS